MLLIYYDVIISISGLFNAILIKVFKTITGWYVVGGVCLEGRTF